MATLLAAVGVALMLGLCCSAASADSVGSFWWQSPVQVSPAGQSLVRISCPSVSLCIATASAAGHLTDVAVSADPTGGPSAWRIAHIDTNSRTSQASLVDISCPSVSLCVAVDDKGYVLTSTSPAGGVGTWSDAKISGTSELYSVSCASESLCVAPGEPGAAAISTNPTGGARAWHTAMIDTTPCGDICVSYGGGPPGAPIDGAISCPSASLCVAGNLTGHILNSADPAGDPGPWRVAFADPNSVYCAHAACPAPIGNIACPSTTLCVAIDNAGYVLRSTDPTGSASSWQMTDALHLGFAPGIPSRPGLACSSKSRCMLLDRERVLVSDDPGGGGPWTPTTIDPGGALTGISCPTMMLCVAVDARGRVIIGRAGPTRAQLSELLRAQLTPGGKASRINAVLRRGGFTAPFASPTPGTIRLRWLHPSGRGRRHPPSALVADGAFSFRAPGRAHVRLHLTRAGSALLRRHTRLRLTAQATFTRPGSNSITITQTIGLRA
jgi:hypothetical protein